MKPEYCEVSIIYDKQAKLFWTIRSRELWFISIVRWKYLYSFLWKSKRSLEINKKLLWSLVPIMKPEYCEVSINYDKQAKLFWTIRSRELWFISIVRLKYLYFFLWKSKRFIALEINKKLLWSLVPIIKRNIVKLALNMTSKPNFHIYIYATFFFFREWYMSHLYFRFSTIIVWINLKTWTVSTKEVHGPGPLRIFIINIAYKFYKIL